MVYVKRGCQSPDSWHLHTTTPEDSKIWKLVFLYWLRWQGWPGWVLGCLSFSNGLAPMIWATFLLIYLSLLASLAWKDPVFAAFGDPDVVIPLYDANSVCFPEKFSVIMKNFSIIEYWRFLFNFFLLILIFAIILKFTFNEIDKIIIFRDI